MATTTPSEKYERSVLLDSIARALRSPAGTYYVMLNLLYEIEPKAELLLARTKPSFIDEIIGREKFSISRGAIEYLSSKYVPIGSFEQFIDLETAKFRFENLLREVSKYRIE
ncbi:MAG TPA: hypothetical protein VFF30_01930 [Nitrososphaerales archaeon]|nr:hypothetical protein [Nitrososphaerales archaeon]